MGQAAQVLQTDGARDAASTVEAFVPTADEAHRAVEACVGAGARDGIVGSESPEWSVDGMGWEAHRAMLLKIREAALI